MEENPYKVGLFYEKGVGVTKSISKAGDWYDKAKIQSDNGVKGLGENLCSFGKADEKVLLKAAYLYSGWNLGGFYRKPKEAKKVARIYTYLARRGNAVAQYMLYLCHKSGDLGEEFSKNEAERWLREAAGQGHNEARLHCLYLEQDNVEEFKKLVLEAVWVSFGRFKLACEFNKWDDIFIEE